mgnify:CR=1 FL=1
MNLQELLAKSTKRPWHVDGLDIKNDEIVGPYETKYTVVYGNDLEEGIPISEQADIELITYAVNHLEGHLEQIRQLREACQEAVKFPELVRDCDPVFIKMMMDKRASDSIKFVYMAKTALKMSEPTKGDE